VTASWLALLARSSSAKDAEIVALLREWFGLWTVLGQPGLQVSRRQGSARILVYVCMVVLLGPGSPTSKERIMDHGSVYRRCGCRDEATGRLVGIR
jgi:hypothetical protein